MWVNPLFESEHAKVMEFIGSTPMATLVAANPMRAAHLPVLLESGDPDCSRLIGHVPRVDPLSEALTGGAEILTIFHGPSSYVSPAWYKTETRLPTYNFLAVHVTGVAKKMGSDEELIAHLKDLIRYHEQTQTHCQTPAWHPGPDAIERMNELLPRIVGFTIDIEKIDGKHKLGQNSTDDDRRSVAHMLGASPDSEDQTVATLMTDLLSEEHAFRSSSNPTTDSRM